jgi:predicted acetyltransferase
MNDKLNKRVIDETGIPDIMDVLAERISPSVLQSLLIEVYRRRTMKADVASLFQRYRSNRFVRPSNADVRKEIEFEQHAFSLLPASYQVIGLSPVAPLGSCSLVAPVSQNNVLTTIRNTEVCADPTNVLALECAMRLEQIGRQETASFPVIKLCSSHRALRTQFFEDPASFPHFKLLCLCAAGRDIGSYFFEKRALAEQILYYVRLLYSLEEMNLRVSSVRVELEVFDRHFSKVAEAVAEDLKRNCGDALIAIAESARKQDYYSDVRYKLYATNWEGKEYFLCDGGFTDWTQQLLQDRKQRFLISGLGTERMLLLFHMQREKPTSMQNSEVADIPIDLVDPFAACEKSYMSLLREIRENEEEPIPFVLKYDADDIHSLVKRCENDAKGIDLPDGFVPHTTYWLVKDGRHVIGVSNLRHKLTAGLEQEGGHIGIGVRPSERGKGYGSLLLKETLSRARAMGIRRALITCNKSNFSSIRTILNNGGVLESEEPRSDGTIIQRYWIDTGGWPTDGCTGSSTRCAR